MIWKIKPDHLSSSFFTPTPGTGMAEEIDKKELAMVDSYDGSCRSPNQAKMKDVDYDWLNKAVALANEGGSEEKLFALADVGEKV
jgi:hypothetical protein